MNQTSQKSSESEREKELQRVRLISEPPNMQTYDVTNFANYLREKRKKEMSELVIRIPYNTHFDLEKREDKTNIFEIIYFLVKQSPKIIKLLYLIVKLIKALAMNNDKKTTVLGQIIVGIIVLILALFKIELPQELKENLIILISAIGAVIYGIKAYFTNKPDKVK